ncbi:MAG: hypothetical protein ACLGH6_05255 [Gammaproteobacteria bacterium]
MKTNRFVPLMAALLLTLGAGAAQAGLPEHRVFAAEGERLLLWVSAARGRTEPELHAAGQLAARGVETWSVDLVSAYFLPQLPRSMDAVPTPDMVEWLRAALARNKQVVVYAIDRAAVPVLRAAAALDPAERARLCVMLAYPNLYTVAEPLAEPEYLNFGSLSGLRVHVLQPRRSAATPWLPGLLDSLAAQGVAVRHTILENLREGWWMRETPTEFEIAESRRMHELLLRELNEWGCK